MNIAPTKAICLQRENSRLGVANALFALATIVFSFFIFRTLPFAECAYAKTHLKPLCANHLAERPPNIYIRYHIPAVNTSKRLLYAKKR
jgi:hypothetical protein